MDNIVIRKIEKLVNDESLSSETRDKLIKIIEDEYGQIVESDDDIPSDDQNDISKIYEEKYGKSRKVSYCPHCGRGYGEEPKTFTDKGKFICSHCWSILEEKEEIN